MAQPEMRFTDGDAYERMMGIWSRLVGEEFLDWMAPATGLVWADIGCGSGALSQLIADRCEPARIHGIDPSDPQLSYARARPVARIAEFRQGDAMALPYADASVDAAAMALVLFFVPDPARGVAEMARIVKPGGWVAAYTWNTLEDQSPTSPIAAELRAMGFAASQPPSAWVSRLQAKRELWQAAGLKDIETRIISVRRTFASFDEFWSTTITQPSVGPAVRSLSPDDFAAVQARVRARLSPAADGSITCEAVANAIKGRKPGA